MKRLVPALAAAESRWCWLGLVALGCILPGSVFAEPAPRKAADDAATAVREALQREIYGLASERRELLSSALAESPEFAPARWHQGFVKDAKKGWLRHDEYSQSPLAAGRLSAYERERAATPETAEGHLKLAAWCAEKEMPAQERAHLTHVLDINPDHAKARAKLGFVKQNGVWVSRQELAREKSREQARSAALKKWQPQIQELREGLEHKSPQRREFALSKLCQIHDPEAIPAIEAVFEGAADSVVMPALETLASMTDPEASLALVRFAVYSPTQPVREAAAAKLGKREYDSFVPQMLSSMYSPVISRFVATGLPNGRIGYRHAFLREGQSRNELMLLDTQYRRVRQPGGDRRDSAERAFEDAATTAITLERSAAIQREFTNRLNDRLAWVLKLATGQELPATPEAWWNWWNQHNEVYVSTSKPTSVIQETREVAVVDVVSTGGSSGGDQGSMDCLAAGTLVWTVKGPIEIELIRVGDLVLSQHPETGELTYQPVLRTTVRPKGKLVKIEAGGETFQTSGGHLFWVAGEGWVKSRELQSGQILHTADGPLHISSIDAGIEAETYNLVVADSNTYFVGYRKVLSHDNTVRQPTRAVVPGLQP